MGLIKNRYLQFMLLVILLMPFFAASHEHQHVHGQGQLLIVQQKQHWHLQFTLPAADVLGFEHTPETPEQIQRVAALNKRLAVIEQVVKFDNACVMEQSESTLPSAHDDAHAHQDIKVEYRLLCESPAKQITLTIFDWVSSLQQVEVQWSHEKGQGMAKLKPSKPELVWLE
ncbi:ZrgA family zinc uptake protein [Pseudoalteromonas sp. SaAl2]